MAIRAVASAANALAAAILSAMTFTFLSVAITPAQEPGCLRLKVAFHEVDDKD